MIKKISSLLVVLFIAACGSTAPSFGFGGMNGVAQGKMFYDVRLVRAVAPGTVQVVTRKGEVIGSAPVEAGVNSNVRVQFDRPITGQNLTAQLLVGGAVVDEDTIQVRRRAES